MKAILGTLLILLLHPSTYAAPLRAGAHATDVSPREFPLNMPGGWRGNRADKVHDPLHARALVLSDGSTQVAMVVVDNLGLAPEVNNEAKAIAQKATGIPPANMLICATHTHTAPGSNSTEGPAPATAYRKLLITGIADSIIQAHGKLQSARIGFAAQPLPTEVFNRRWHLKPGKMPLNPFGKMDRVKMNPSRSAGTLDRPAGPTDPDITVLSVRDGKNKPLCLFANYALHYVGAIPRGMISADYFGEFARLMPTRLNADERFVSMMSNGASGDINNIPFTATRAPREPFEQVRTVAQGAADTAWQAYKAIDEYATEVPLGMIERDIALKYRKPTAQQIEWAKDILAIEDEGQRKKLPQHAESYARRAMVAAKRPDTLTAKLQAIRIGDFAVVGIPFETLVEIGIELKEKSPFARTMVIGLANGRHGYLPTPKQHKLGGYETWLGTCNVQLDASEIVTAHLLEMLNELHASN